MRINLGLDFVQVIGAQRRRFQESRGQLRDWWRDGVAAECGQRRSRTRREWGLRGVAKDGWAWLSRPRGAGVLGLGEWAANRLADGWTCNSFCRDQVCFSGHSANVAHACCPAVQSAGERTAGRVFRALSRAGTPLLRLRSAAWRRPQSQRCDQSRRTSRQLGDISAATRVRWAPARANQAAL